MNNALSLLSFGPDIIQWIALFFKNMTATILMGGMSDEIHLRQGVPQGDVIFTLMVELLLLKINYTKHLTGIVFAKVVARRETFADDTTIFLERTANNLRYATNSSPHFTKFEAFPVTSIKR
jgi:hypothetical protein